MVSWIDESMDRIVSPTASLSSPMLGAPIFQEEGGPRWFLGQPIRAPVCGGLARARWVRILRWKRCAKRGPLLAAHPPEGVETSGRGSVCRPPKKGRQMLRGLCPNPAGFLCSDVLS